MKKFLYITLGKFCYRVVGALERLGDAVGKNKVDLLNGVIDKGDC